MQFLQKIVNKDCISTRYTLSASLKKRKIKLNFAKNIVNTKFWKWTFGKQ